MTPEQLKASIYQMAIQGKLVEQRPEEGTGEDLYRQIQLERKKYKIKDIFIEDLSEIPFDIPETWKWIHLQDIVKKTIKRGKSPKYSEKSQVQVFAQKCNVKTGGINMGLALFLDANTMDKYPDEEYLCNGDIIINSTGGGTMGRVGIFHDTDRYENMAIVPDSHVTIIRACDEIDYNYLYYFLKQNQRYLETQGEGSTNQTELKPATIASIALPLPPFAEQHRIVAKIEELLTFVDRYAEAYKKLEQFNAKFPEDMKKSILQYAIQGKLVEQRPEEGTAEKLYLQIQEEKQKLIKEGNIKKEKPLAEITEDEIPFDIPESWKWVRLGDCVSILGDGIHGTPNYIAKGKYYFINGNNLFNGSIVIKQDTKTVSNEEYEKYKKELNDHTVMVSINGTIGNVAFYNCEKVILGKSACYFNLIDRQWKRYIYWIIKSDFFIKYALTNATGSTIKNVSLAAMKNFMFPLPPLKEQQRIVEKIEELLPLCEKLNK